jgi:hypothetical protein
MSPPPERDAKLDPHASGAGADRHMPASSDAARPALGRPDVAPPLTFSPQRADFGDEGAQQQ